MTSKRTRKFDFSSEEKKKEYIQEVIAFFHAERDEEIGIIAAGKVLDLFLDTFAEDIYQKAIGDVKKLLRSKIEDLELEVDMLASPEAP